MSNKSNVYKTRMHSSRMRTTRLRIVRGGGRCCDLWPWPGGRCYDLWPWPWGEVLWPLTLGVLWPLTLARGGRLYDLWHWLGGVMTFDPGQGEGGRCYDLWPWPGGGGGWSLVLSISPPPKYYRMTDACENITFARFATRVVIIFIFKVVNNNTFPHPLQLWK